MAKEILRPGFQSIAKKLQDLESGSFALNNNTIPYLSIPSFQSIAISTRIGGVSQHPYESLNLGYHVGDDPETVNENRARFCDAIDVDIESLVLAQQVHGDKVMVIDDSQAGFGAYSHEGAIPEADGMVTKSRSVALAVLTADCVPVLVLDPVKRAIGIAHAGWRGLLKRIPFKTIIMMGETFGTDASECMVAFGPSIGPCCYEVSEDLVDAFGRAKLPLSHQKDRLDLQLIAKTQLTNAGVKEENIYTQEICTSCRNDLLYSYRADGGTTGRIMSVIRLIHD